MKFKETKEDFDSIYRAYSADVYRASLHIVKNSEIASQMMQQAFANFYYKAETVNPGCVKAYLICAARNLSKNYVTSKDYKLRYEPRNSANDEENISQPEPSVPSTEETYFDSYEKDKRSKFGNEIMTEVQKHNPEWHEILYDMFYLEKDHDEIAVELGISKEVLYSRLYRAKKWIRKHFDNQMKQLEDEI